MSNLKRRFSLAAICLSVIGAGAVQAADDPNIARMWVVTPKAGMDQQLEDAMKAHNQWRVDNNDPWPWSTYHQVTGSDLGDWLIRSCCHSWADMEAYGNSDFSTAAYEHWMANVEPYVAETAGHMSEAMPEISNWPEDAGPYEWVWAYTYKVKPGKANDFIAAAKAIVDELKKAGWGEPFGFVRQLDGEIPRITLVIGEDSWSGFAGPEKSAREVVAEALGQAKADDMWDAYLEHVKSVYSTVYHRHEDMSFQGAP